MDNPFILRYDRDMSKPKPPTPTDGPSDAETVRGNRFLLREPRGLSSQKEILKGADGRFFRDSQKISW